MLKVFDSNILIPKDKIIVVGGKEFTINFIPMSISIRVYEIMGRVNENIPALESIELMVNIVTDILKINDPTVDAKWIMDNLDIRQLNPLFFEMCNIMSSLGEENGKKQELPQAKLRQKYT